MTIFALQIRANLENISRLVPVPGNLWKFDIVSPSSERKEGITVGSEDEIPLEGSRGTANYVMHWPGSRQQSYIKIVPLHKCSGMYSNQDGEFETILGLECRGLEIEKWIPSIDFSVETVDGMQFHDVDLSDPDGWAEYDDRNDKAISITDLEYRINCSEVSCIANRSVLTFESGEL